MRPSTDAAVRRREIEWIFETAVGLTPTDRPRWLTTICGDDVRLRTEVDALIAAHERPDGLLDGNLAVAAGEILSGLPRNSRIGAYRIIRELGRGGMGIVYLARRDDGQYDQLVAIKV